VTTATLPAPAMAPADGRVRVEPGGVGCVVWYHLTAPGVDRWLPTVESLAKALAETGVELADLGDV
jgi:hypothetical protein